MKTDAPAQRRTDAPTRWRSTVRGGLLVLALPLALARGARAQTPAPQQARAPALVHYGKWAAFGVASGLTVLGVLAHQRADDSYATLLDYCRTQASCRLGLDGRYTNSGAESLYLRVRDNDRAARAWLLGGQAALVGGTVLLVMELKRTKGPENVPFAPYVVAGRFGTLVGWRVAWR